MTGYKKYFSASVKEHYPEDSDLIIAETDINFEVFSKDTGFALNSANPIDRRLDFSAYFFALVKTLDGRGEAYEAIRNICIEIVLEYVRPKNRFQLFLKRLPVRLVDTRLAHLFLKVMDKKISRKAHQDGFVAKIITDKSETFGFGYGIDILECGICKLFKKHQHEKYAPILCEVDKITSAFAGLQLIRTGTIAMGAKKCDFRFKRSN